MSAVRTIGFNEPLTPEAQGDDLEREGGPEYVWVRFAADQAPADGLDYRSALDSVGASPTQVTGEAILEDVRVLERSARKLRRFVNGIANRSVEVAEPRERPRIDEATREKARRALAKSGFVRVKP